MDEILLTLLQLLFVGLTLGASLVIGVYLATRTIIRKVFRGFTNVFSRLHTRRVMIKRRRRTTKIYVNNK